MLAQPHTPVSDSAPHGNGQAHKPGRDTKGRFTAGNRLGRGNPFARQVAALRTTLLHRVTPEVMNEIADSLITRARVGDLVAMKLLFTYVLGKPAEQPDPDRLDVEEWQLLKEAMVPPGEREELTETLSVQLALPQAKGALDEREETRRCAAEGYVQEVAHQNARTRELFTEAFRVYREEKAKTEDQRPVQELFQKRREDAPRPGPGAPSANGGGGSAPEAARPAAASGSPAERPQGGTGAAANGKSGKPSAGAASAAPSANGFDGGFGESAALLQSDEDFWAEIDALLDDDDGPSPDGVDGTEEERE